MWIKKERYEALVSRNDNLETMLESYRTWNRTLLIEKKCLDEQYKKDVEFWKNLCEEYKQKYANEVQKRLELIELYERQTNN